MGFTAPNTLLTQMPIPVKGKCNGQNMENARRLPPACRGRSHRMRIYTHTHTLQRKNLIQKEMCDVSLLHSGVEDTECTLNPYRILAQLSHSDLLGWLDCSCIRLNLPAVRRPSGTLSNHHGPYTTLDTSSCPSSWSLEPMLRECALIQATAPIDYA